MTITTMYLSGDAKLWWQTRSSDDAAAGQPKIKMWETLKKELKDQFLSTNITWMARVIEEAQAHGLGQRLREGV